MDARKRLTMHITGGGPAIPDMKPRRNPAVQCMCRVRRRCSLAPSWPGFQRLCLSSGVSCDMKLQSVLLGGAILTKPCVSPQVFHGSMRLTGSGWVAATARGVEPSRKCIKPGSLKLEAN